MMNLNVPRNEASELLLYIWKIIDLPSISFPDLIHAISFELFLLSPENARNLVNKSLEKQFLTRENDTLTLSANLRKQLESWQIMRKNKIMNALELNKEEIFAPSKIKSDKKPEFNVLLKAFLEKGTINRAASVSNDSFNIINFDEEKGYLKAEVKGTKEKSYEIEIDTNKMLLRHDCYDFQTHRAVNKKFCKHLAKLFLLLKEKNEAAALDFLQKISEKINEWQFVS